MPVRAMVSFRAVFCKFFHQESQAPEGRPTPGACKSPDIAGGQTGLGSFFVGNDN
jgi:hypothetical protein